MSRTVEIYVADRGELLPLAQRVGEELGVSAYFASRSSAVFALDASRWIGAEGTGTLTLAPTDAEPDDGTALAPYAYELSLEYRGGDNLARGELRERFGRALFDGLRALERPLAYADDVSLYADYLPGRGTRDFDTGADWDEDGRDRWNDPRLYGPDAEIPAPEPPPVPRGSVTVFETGGLVQFVPTSTLDSRSLVPAVSVRADQGDATIGRALALALARSSSTGGTRDGDPFRAVAGTAGGLSPDEYARTAVSVDLAVEGETILAVPHLPHTGEPLKHIAQGPVVDSLALRESRAWDDAAMGRTLLDLIAATRAHAGHQRV
ncbi:hypothetical protein [Spirillospora sp. CA-294931]|uniref:hypothetical protein n=1 Tax=Spirillospora sp. CA-294931 TaxID=3240042 RepID=UPI003D8E687A